MCSYPDAEEYGLTRERYDVKGTAVREETIREHCRANMVIAIN
jgi:hypothetical protein